MVIQVPLTTNDSVRTVEYPIYKATLPFGVITTSGEIDGGFVFGTGGFHGEMYSEETYYIKYFDGEELKSLSLDASETPLVVDGSFTLEVTYMTRTSWILIWKITCYEDEVVGYRIHIPELPEVNMTLSEDWIR
jgi:hypothetical protein